MQNSDCQLFPSKLLLFGEYGLMYGSKALSVPFDTFHGKFQPDFKAVRSRPAQQSNHHLIKYFTFLKENIKSGGFIDLDLNQLELDILSGLYFDSNIPQGYGLGSSGALVAALVSNYGITNENNTSVRHDLPGLKTFFSKMESYFHGKSSGLDPLISYVNKPILINPPSEISTLDLPVFNQTSKGAMFLIDSGSSGETQPLVDYFVMECKKKDFLDLIVNRFIPVTNQCVTSYLEADAENLLKNVQLLSEFQMNDFKKMIPDSLFEVWNRGIQSGNFSLKLCGSGGGGMTLGFTADYEKCRGELKDFNMQVIHRI